MSLSFFFTIFFGPTHFDLGVIRDQKLSVLVVYVSFHHFKDNKAKSKKEHQFEFKLSVNCNYYSMKMYKMEKEI